MTTRQILPDWAATLAPFGPWERNVWSPCRVSGHFEYQSSGPDKGVCKVSRPRCSPVGSRCQHKGVCRIKSGLASVQWPSSTRRQAGSVLLPRLVAIRSLLQEVFPCILQNGHSILRQQSRSQKVTGTEAAFWGEEGLLLSVGDGDFATVADADILVSLHTEVSGPSGRPPRWLPLLSCVRPPSFGSTLHEPQVTFCQGADDTALNWARSGFHPKALQ